MIRICVHDDSAAVAKAAAELVYERLKSHAGPGRLNIALSGGSTPKLMYETLRQLPRTPDLFNDRAEIFFSDERAVALDSVESNYHTAAVGLLQPLSIRADIVHPFRGDAPDSNAEAMRYEAEIRRVVPAGPGGVPVFDLVILGMGPEGHTASLFSDFDFDEHDFSLVAAPYVGARQSYRLTFTLRLINQARTVLFMVTGQEKARALKNVLSADSSGDILPAGRVEAAETIWIVDAAAASELAGERLRGTVETC